MVIQGKYLNFRNFTVNVDLQNLPKEKLYFFSLVHVLDGIAGLQFILCCKFFAFY
jgi:hypothetical protein